MTTSLLATQYNPDVLSCLANLSNDEVFTPPALVNRMLDMLPQELFRSPRTRFLDPVSKTGVFLREIAKRLIVGLEEAIPDQQERINHIYTQQLYGIAITELTAMLSRRSVYCSKRADSEYSVCNAFTTEEGNIRYRRIRHTWANGKCTYCGAARNVYDRSSDLETHAYEFIHTNKPNTLFNNMKFDVIIGNPPYQLDDGGNGASAKPIYHLFVEQAKKLNPRYLCMIIPARWFAGGKGLDEFREQTLNDDRFRYIKDFVNAKDCFPNNSIGGGVCYFLWGRDYHGTCDFTTSLNGVESNRMRKLNEYPVFVRYNQAVDIIEKVKQQGEACINSIMLSRNPFGLTTAERGRERRFEGCYKLISSKGEGFISPKEVLQNDDFATAYKVMISRITVEHAGEPDRNGQLKLLSSLRVLQPNEVCTDSYLIFGKFDNGKEAENLCSYLGTKFARFLLLQAVSSINLSKDKFLFVPLQDFSRPWTDADLYAKYNLSEDEIAFIESMIRPME